MTDPHTSPNPYTFPPGLVGEIAQFIYAQAPRPVAEIALAGAIGLMAGICGRAFNVSNPPTGLNQYVLLLAPTGTGKEAIASGYGHLMQSIRQAVPNSADFIGPGEIASHQAIVKYMANGPKSFVSVTGEFGIYLQQMANPKAPIHLVGLRRFLLDVYGKSGFGSEVRPSIYSDREKNTTSIVAPALSIVGESTPEKFYEGLHEGLISEGLLPRFTIIEYHGERPPLNEEACIVPSPEIYSKLTDLCSYSLSLQSGKQPATVLLTPEAKIEFDDFNSQCDDAINAASKEVTRHLWNRAHLKALKLAALVAVGWNPYQPTITFDFALWAIQIEKANVRNLLARFEAGDVGEQASSETAQQNRLRAVIKDWFTKPWSEVGRYGIGTEAMRDGGVIPYSYLSKRLTNDAAFKNAKNGATATLKRTIDELFKCGEMNRVSAEQLKAKYGKTMDSYAITDVGQFLTTLKRETKTFFWGV